MKINYFWLVALCFSLFAFRPLAWVPISLDSRVSVLLPSQPRETPLPAPAKMLSLKDTVGTYIIVASPLGKDFQGIERQGYYDSVIEGILENGHGKLESRSTFSVGSYEGIGFVVSVVRPDNQQTMLVFARCIIVDKRCYVLQYIPTNGGKNEVAQCKMFLNSITLH